MKIILIFFSLSLSLFLVSKNEHTGEIAADFMVDRSSPTESDRKFQLSVKQITNNEISDLLIRERYERAILFGIDKLIALIEQKKQDRCRYVPKIKFFPHLYNCP